MLYAVLVFIFAGLVGLVLFGSKLEPLGLSSTRPFLLSGVISAALTFWVGIWVSWRNGALNRTDAALCDLRTNGEYLANANVVNQYAVPMGKPMNASVQAMFNDTSKYSTVDHPSFRSASLFVLNQYEFLAGAVRAGAMDYGLVKSTMRTPVIRLVVTYGPIIRQLRQDQIARGERASSYDNLLWLYRCFRGMKPYDRGPYP